MRIGMIVLAAMCVLLGLAPTVVVPLLDHAIHPMIGNSIAAQMLALGGWTVIPVGTEFSSLSSPALALLLAGSAMAALALTALAGARHAKRYVRTWGCGLKLSPRMEYTATGFVQPIKRVFGTIYRPTVKLETDLLHESQYFAKSRRFTLQIEPVFETYLYQPVAAVIPALAGRLRVIQAGSLHVYLAYMFVTLVLLLLIAL
jgi:hydrogenase-4 component B